MKKLLITALLVLFATAAYAEVKFDVSGDYRARGWYWQNQAADSTDTIDYSYYDHRLRLWPKLSVGNTTITTKLVIRNEKWAGGTGATAFVNSWDELYDDPDYYSGSMDDNLLIERCYLTHKFDNGVTLDVGLMDGQTWGTVFGDYQQPRYRVKVVGTTPVGVVGGLVEKMSDQGYKYSDIKDAEKDDWDDYAIFMVTKVGDIYIKPLIYYIDNSAAVGHENGTLDPGSEGVQVWYLSLEVSGALGDGLAFESELNYKDISYEDLQDRAADLALLGNAKDATVWGAYFNVWKTMDVAKVGFLASYGSWDDEGGTYGQGVGLDTRDDFCANFILGDELAFGGTTAYNAAPAEDLLAMTFLKLYVSDVKTPVDKLTCSGSFGYMMSNQDAFSGPLATLETNVFEDATAWEIDLGVAYAISENLKYSIDFGYADVDLDVEGEDDPDPIYALMHKIQLTF